MSSTASVKTDSRLPPRSSTIKLIANSEYNKSIYSSKKIISDDEEDIPPPTSLTKKIITTPQPILSTRMKKIKNKQTTQYSNEEEVEVVKTSIKINHLDLQLIKMGFTILFSLHSQDKDEAKIILAMSPLGTIVGINLDIEGNITTAPERRINITVSDGTLHLNSSYLTNISKRTEISSMVVCKEGICLFMRNNLGKILAEHYDIKSESDNIVSESPTSYPLINISDIIENFLDFTTYSTFLNNLTEDSHKINKVECDNQIKMLEQNIEFMSNLLSNLNNLQSKAIDFEVANNREFKSTAEVALTLLQRRLSANTLNQFDSDQWKSTQDKLYSLNRNSVIVTNGVRSFNCFRGSIDIIDREAYIFYFSLYSSVIKSIDSPANVDIRRPDNWTLTQVLPRSEEALLQTRGQITAEDFTKRVREDMLAFNPTNSDADTIALSQSFSASFK
jgi:hypothetical protein